MQLIDESRFSEEWGAKLAWEGTESESNWRLRASNLRKLVKGLRELLESEAVGPLRLDALPSPDVVEIAQHESKADLAGLLQLLVVAALKSPTSGMTMVEHVRGQEEWVQMAVMQAMKGVNVAQESPRKVADSGGGGDSGDRDEELGRTKAALSEAQRRLTELEQEVWTLGEERDGLLQAKRLEASEVGGLEDVLKRAAALTATNDQLKQQLAHTESVQADTAERLEEACRENEELKLRLTELSGMEAGFRALKDEVEELRLKDPKLKALETANEQLRRKLEESRDLRAQCEMLNSKVAAYMPSVIALEEEQRKNSALKIQLEALQKSSVEQGERLASEAKRADKATYEAASASERLSLVTSERDRLADEARQLRESSAGLGSEPGEILAESLGGLTSPQPGRESSGELEELLGKARRDLEEEGSRRRDLETEARLAGQRISELEKQVAALGEVDKRRSDSETDRLQELHKEAEQKGLRVEQLEGRLKEAESAGSNWQQRQESARERPCGGQGQAGEPGGRAPDPSGEGAHRHRGPGEVGRWWWSLQVGRPHRCRMRRRVSGRSWRRRRPRWSD